MKVLRSYSVLCAIGVSLCVSCASAASAPKTADTVDTADTFDNAIESCAREIEQSLEAGVSVAVVGFESADLMEEFMGYLIKGKKLVVADRSKLELIYREIGLSWSDNFSEETAVRIGKMVGARFVITGSLTDRSSSYRLRVTAINTETAVREAFASVNISKDDKTIGIR
jgi:TolB-like protein